MPNPAYFGRRLCHRPASIPNVDSSVSAVGGSLAAYFRPTVLWRERRETSPSQISAAGAAALPLAPHAARAQAYPARPVRIVVVVAAGGGNDIVARLIGQFLSEKLGQSFIIENRPGAGGNIGTEAVVRAPADGYTLLLVAGANTINATLYEKLSFNFISDIAACCWDWLSSQPYRGSSISSGQDRFRVDRLRKGQSGQAQHGVWRHRHAATCGR